MTDFSAKQVERQLPQVRLENGIPAPYAVRLAAEVHAGAKQQWQEKEGNAFLDPMVTRCLLHIKPGMP